MIFWRKITDAMMQLQRGTPSIVTVCPGLTSTVLGVPDEEPDEEPMEEKGIELYPGPPEQSIVGAVMWLMQRGIKNEGALDALDFLWQATHLLWFSWQ